MKLALIQTALEYQKGEQEWNDDGENVITLLAQFAAHNNWFVGKASCLPNINSVRKVKLLGIEGSNLWHNEWP
jgi:hypothetical protein